MYHRREGFGIKYIFLISVIGFTLALALCGAATSLGELVLFRALQGVAGAGLIPLSQATLLQINPPERHGYARPSRTKPAFSMTRAEPMFSTSHTAPMRKTGGWLKAQFTTSVRTSVMRPRPHQARAKA